MEEDKVYNFLFVMFNLRWLSAQFSSLSQLDMSKIEVWITCIYSDFFFLFQVKYGLKFLSSRP